MWSTCSIETGHSWTHAPQVTQSQTTSSVTALARAGVGSNAPSARSCRALGEQLVAEAHDQELRRELLAGGVGRADVLAAPALGARHRVEHLLPGHVGDGRRRRSGSALVLGLEVERLEPAARARAAEPDVDRRRGDVQVLRVREVGEEAEDEQHVRPDEDPLEHLGRARRRRRRRPRPRPATSPRATRSARARSATRARAAACHDRRSARGSGRPRRGGCPRSARGRCTLRIQSADATPTRTSTANTSTRSANQPWCPSHGERRARRSTAPISAMRIVGNRTRKPQKMNACMSPGTSRWRSFRWPSTTTASLRTRRGTSSTAAPACRAGRADEHQRAAGEERARDGEHGDERERRRRRCSSRRGEAGAAASSLRAELGRDRRQHLVEVADRRRSPRLARIGASGSVFTARILFAPLQPAMCWVAPLTPQAM